MRKPIEGPAGWRGSEIASARDWIHEFRTDEIEAAPRSAEAHGKTLDTLTSDDFPLPTVTKRTAFARDFLENGRGLFQFRGIRTEGHSKDDLRLL